MFRPVRGSEAAKSFSRLTVGGQGVALTFRDGTNRTILWKRCVGVAWSEGHRWIICDDGFAVLVKAEDWRHGSDAQALIDRSVPEDLFIPLDGTAPDSRLPPGVPT
jgi:hypothetical protein